MLDQTDNSVPRWARLVTVALALATLSACGGGSSPDPATSSRTATPKRPKIYAPLPPRIDTASLLGGIPQSGVFLGSPTAPVTLQFFADVACPPSRTIVTKPFARVIPEWVRTGRLRLEFRSVEEGTESNSFVDGQLAALAAGLQNRLWDYLEDFFQYQDEELGSGNTDSCHLLAGITQKVAPRVAGLNLALWRQGLHSRQLEGSVAADERFARKAKLENPGFLIGRTGRRAMSLPRFAREDPAYATLASEILSTEVQL